MRRPGWSRALRVLPRRTLRLRLTALYGSLFLISGAGLLAILYGLLATAALGGRVRLPGGAGELRRLAAEHRVGDIERLMAVQRTATLHQLVLDSAIALAATTLVSAWLGWLMAGRALRPLRAMTATARQISEQNLHQRLEIAGPADEITELAGTFDGLLARLEAAFEAQRQFAANASHELRTPLTWVRAMTEIALTDPRPTVESLLETCERVLVACRQQERLIEALLTLARSQRGLDRRDPFDLTAVTDAALATRRPAAARQGLRIDATLSHASAAGDRRLAERLVANLLDNALRHNVPGGQVDVVTAASAGQAIVRVANTGPVIPEPEVARLFRPFHRFGDDRTGHGDGHGLGLPIVVAIAEAHDASLTARPQPSGGLAVEVRFPGAGAHPGVPKGTVEPGQFNGLRQIS